jgi:uncharacterized repeat protein (TIGR01451 family)
MKSKGALSLCLSFAVSVVFVLAGNGIRQASAQSVISKYRLPLSFEKNVGQTDNGVKFLARGKGYTLFLTEDEAVFSLAGARSADNSSASAAAVFRTRFVGANVSPVITATGKLPGRSNYFLGSDPAKWHVGVPEYGQVRYRNLYPGIDLIYYGRDGQLEYDLALAAGADPHRIRFAVEGTNQLSLNDQGDVLLTIGDSDLIMRKPFVYQLAAGSKHAVTADYVLLGKNEIGLKIGPYDSRKSLVIDPALVYSTYLGGSGADGALASAVDSKGNAYLTGGTVSTDFPVTAGVVQPTYGGTGNCGSVADISCGDVFVTKFNATGSALVWSTYLGGSADDYAFTIFVDTSSNVYVAGQTKSTNFPVTAGAFQTMFKGTHHDGFISKLNSTGTALLYSTFLSGSTGKSSVAGITVDSSGNLYAVGGTSDTDFPVTAGAFETTCKACSTGDGDGFITKLNSTGSAQIYSTFLGGSTGAVTIGIAVDSSGNAYVTGETVDTDFPTLKPIQPTFGGGGVSCNGHLGPCGDAFVTKLNPTGTALVYSTYLGGSGEDTGFSIKIDSSGDAYVAGATDSSNFPTTSHAFQKTFGGGAAGCVNNGVTCGDAFVTKVNAAGSAWVFSTYLGGNGDDGILFGLAVDSSRNVHLAGATNSSNFPVTANATQPTYGGGTTPCPVGVTCGDAFRTTLNSTGSALTFSTFLGGSSDDGASGMALDSLGYAYVAGVTTSTNFPIAGTPFQKTCSSCSTGIPDAFLTKIGPSADLSLTLSAPASVVTGSTITYTIQVTNLGPDTATNLQIAESTPTGTTFNSVSLSVAGKCTAPSPGSTGSVSCSVSSLGNGANVTETLVVNVTAASGSTITDRANATSKTFDPNTKNNSATAKTSVT